MEQSAAARPAVPRRAGAARSPQPCTRGLPESATDDTDRRPDAHRTDVDRDRRRPRSLHQVDDPDVRRPAWSQDFLLNTIGADPTEGMRGVRQLGFVGAHLYPLRYSAERPLKSVGRPITLDTIACDFPELKLVGIHIGWPWTEEMISVAYKHPNVYIGSDAYAPRYWAPEQDKVLFGTDFPVIDPERARREIDALGLRPEAARKFLRDNALRLYKLPDGRTQPA